MSNIEITNSPESPHFIESHDSAGLEHPAASREPWLEAGVSRAQWYRQRAADAKRPPQTRARLALAGWIAARDEATAKMAERQQAILRVEGELSNGAGAATEIAAFDAADAAALSAWARTGGDLPSVDTVKRETLAKLAADAAARTAALTQAHAALVAEYAAEAQAVPALADQVELAIDEILLETSGALIEALRVTAADLASQKERLNILANVISARAGVTFAHGVAVQGAAPGLALLIGEVKRALDAPPDDAGASAARLAWLELASALRTDSAARLES